MGLKFRARVIVYQDTKKRISSLHGSLFIPVQRSGNKTEVLQFLKPSVPTLDQLIVLPIIQLIALFLSLLLPLESISQKPGLPRRTGEAFSF